MSEMFNAPCPKCGYIVKYGIQNGSKCPNCDNILEYSKIKNIDMCFMDMVGILFFIIILLLLPYFLSSLVIG